MTIWGRRARARASASAPSRASKIWEKPICLSDRSISERIIASSSQTSSLISDAWTMSFPFRPRVQAGRHCGDRHWR
jgi:hypothetical protein